MRALALCFIALAAAAQQPSPLQHAAVLARAGQLSAALSATDQILAHTPSSVPALNLRIQILDALDRPEQAAETCRQVLALQPAHAHCLARLGTAALAAHQFDQASDLLGRAAKLDPRSSETAFYLAQALQHQHQPEAALDAMRRAARLDPTSAVIQQKLGEFFCSATDYTACIGALTRARELDATLPGLDTDLGLACFRAQHYDQAVEHLSRALSAHPSDLSALSLSADAYVHLGQWQQAYDLYTHLLLAMPDDHEGLLNFAHAAIELKHPAEAVPALEHLLRLDPQQLLAHFYLARAYAQLGQTEPSRHQAQLHQIMMQQATYARSSGIAAHEQLLRDQALATLATAGPDKVIDLYLDRFHADHPDAAEAWVFLAHLYFLQHNIEAGVHAAEHALQLSAHASGAHTALGTVALSRGDLASAEREFQAELAIDPAFQDAIAELGEIRYRAQQWPDAARLLLQSRTDKPQLIYMLADTLYHLNRASEANLYVEVAASLAAANPNLIRDLAELARINAQPDLAARISAH